jgi:GT2 family glycosyltransferase
MLLSCLAGLKQQRLKDFEVILVDNGSSDGSPHSASQMYPGLTLLLLNTNHGFAGACARAWDQASGEWIAVLNNDAVPEPGWLEEMYEAATSEDRVGMVAPRVVQEQDNGLIDSLGMLAGRNGLIYLIGHGDPANAHPESPRFEDVFGPPAVAALYSRKMLEEIGFFKPDFFAYYEDADLAFRGRWAGWRCLLANRARVRHGHSATAEAIGLSKTYYLQKNRLRTVVRNWPVRSFVKNFPYLIFYNILSTLAAVYADSSLDAFRAWLAFAGGFFADLCWRFEQKPLRRVPPKDIDTWLSRGYPSALELFQRRRDENR